MKPRVGNDHGPFVYPTRVDWGGAGLAHILGSFDTTIIEASDRETREKRRKRVIT